MGDRGVKPKNPPWEGYEYFLELHNLKQILDLKVKFGFVTWSS